VKTHNNFPWCRFSGSSQANFLSGTKPSNKQIEKKKNGMRILQNPGSVYPPGHNASRRITSLSTYDKKVFAARCNCAFSTKFQ
jgi:hypothetical protein